MSALAVRRHLQGLRRDRLVKCRAKPASIGRPAMLWLLAPAAERFFPDRHADLVLRLLKGMTAAFGPSGVRALVASLVRAATESYGKEVPRRGPLQERLKALARKHSEEGYMAELQRDRDGGFLVCANHCPIRSGALASPDLCDVELRVFSNVLGPDVSIARVEHILAGDRRCAFRVHSTETR